jgi:hypothetical protein
MATPSPPEGARKCFEVENVIELNDAGALSRIYQRRIMAVR